MAGYGDDPGFTAWLAANGYTLPPGAPTAAVLRERGSSYIDNAYGGVCGGDTWAFKGSPTGGFMQERAWPRTGVVVYGVTVPDDVVPAAVVNASYRAAWIEATNPGSLSITVNPHNRVRRQKVDVIEREFFDGLAGDDTGMTGVMNTDIHGALLPFLCEPAGDGGTLGFWAIGC